jgi:ABC-type Mn2+/Zn2+ transport system permease subunit
MNLGSNNPFVRWRLRGPAAPLFLAILGLLCAATFGAERPNADNSIDDILNQIDKAAPPTTTPLPRHSESIHATSIKWWRLVLLFLPALLTAAAVGVAGSVAGLFVLLRREGLVALAIPQVVAVGAAIGMRMGWPTLPPALLTAAVALVYFVLAKRWGAGNWILPSFYVAGLSLSFLIIANHGQEVADMENLFVGIDVAVTPHRAMLAAPLLLLAAVACAALWRRWLILAQAPATAELAGLSPAAWDAVFLAILTLVLLLGTDSLGVVMVLAMLFLPAATVLPWARRIPAAMAASAALSLVFLAAGFYLSNTMGWPLSQSVGGVGFVVLAFSHTAAMLRR